MTFQFAERDQLCALEFPDPSFADLVDRHRVEVVQFLASMLHSSDEVRRLQNPEMLGHGLPCHGEAVAKFEQRLSVAGVKPIQQ